MALKKIQYDVRLLSTEKMSQANMPIVYTNDLNSAEFVFNIDDMTAEQLVGATATTLIYMRDGSFFQNSDVNLNGNTFTYLLKENEGNHAGLAKIQLVVKIGTAEYASQLHSFGVVSGLETKVATEVMIQDWTILTREARAYIDGLEAKDTEMAEIVANAKAQVEANILETAVAEKYAGLEAQYATDLATLKQSDVSLTAQLHRKVGDGVKAEPEDLSATTLGLVTGTGGPINLLSVPQDSSVTPTKTTFYKNTGNLFNVLTPNTNLLSGSLTIDGGDNVSVIKVNGKPSALGATTVALMTGSSATGTYIAFDTSAQYTLTAKLLSGKCFDTRAVSLVVQRTDNSAPMASINAGSLLQNGGVRTATFTPTVANGKVSLIFSAGAYDINDCEILINITKSATPSVEPFGYRILKSVDNYEQSKKIESLIKHDMYDYIVDKAGTGDFTTLTECVRQAKDMSVIYVKNGLYGNEIVKAWLKTVFIIGESRDGVIITNSTGEYATPPVEMGTGLLRNLTIYAKNPGGLTPTNKGYALHSESTVYNYFKFEVDNCNILSDWRQSWGMGMRGSMVYNAHNVNFDGGVYFHDNEHADGTVQKIFFDTCNITRNDTGAALIFQNQQMANADIDVRFNRCFIKSLQGSEILFYKWDSIKKTVIPATGFADFPSWKLSSFSWGNSEAALNA